jgi:RNA polymerase sigma-70 factor (family 1)
MTTSYPRASGSNLRPSFQSKFPGMDRNPTEIEVLLNKIINHDDYAAFERLFNGMYGPLCQFCLRFVLVHEVAEELVSDVFYTIWKNRDRIEVSSPRSYLFTAVRNRGIDYLRKVRKNVSCSIDQASHLPSTLATSQEMLLENELSEKIEKGIAALPRQCRTIFTMSREQGLKYREIADELQISIKTVETQMGRALKHLHTAVAAD